MPKLVELEIGLRICCTISPQNAGITGCKCHDILSDDIWSSLDLVSSSVGPHSSFKSFKAGVIMRTGEILQKTVQQFSNLEEHGIGQSPGPYLKPSLTIFAVERVSSILQDFHSLQRLKWNRDGGSIELDDLIENLLAAGRSTSLERYELNFNQLYNDDYEHVGLEGCCRRKEQLLCCLKNWPKDSKCLISISRGVPGCLAG
jgi:hypothetical protein